MGVGPAAHHHLFLPEVIRREKWSGRGERRDTDDDNDDDGSDGSMLPSEAAVLLVC